MDVEDEEENKALTEELVASLRDTVRGEVFFCVRSLTSSSSFFMSFGYFFLSLLSFDSKSYPRLRDATTADEGRRPSLSIIFRLIRECTSSRTSSTSILSRVGKTTMGKDGRTKAF